MVSDHLSDFITRIRNGYLASRETISAPNVKTVERVAQVLVKTGYVTSVAQDGKQLIVTLKYTSHQPAIMGLRRMSRPGARVYCGFRDLPKVWGGLGINILSTPKGIMGEKEAKKLSCGGELIAQVW